MQFDLLSCLLGVGTGMCIGILIAAYIWGKF